MSTVTDADIVYSIIRDNTDREEASRLIKAIRAALEVAAAPRLAAKRDAEADHGILVSAEPKARLFDASECRSRRRSCGVQHLRLHCTGEPEWPHLSQIVGSDGARSY